MRIAKGKRILSANVLERINREIRRKPRVVSIFSSLDSLNRI